ncbi:MAG: LuxR family transcriptional regulator [Cytophagia bacterium]|jgi:DNA-binding CsgD family transcriptional regulator/PAS domain-containing protein|nr:MAG: LuxR family transcriptional regulator [Cytophagales bacterium]TAG42936.1 MAG: LuxR family transcriptional regulator [Cytophagia bacterium]
MNDTDKAKIGNIYLKLLNQQEFAAEELDYSNFNNHMPTLQALSTIGNSGISVFDLFKKEHIFYSPNFCTVLGYNLQDILDNGHHFIDNKIHPDDFIELMKNGITLLKLFYQFSSDEKTNYKLINEYRVLNAENKYIKILEQHQVLELDKYGNLWLTLSTIDISPNQDIDGKMKSQLVNFRTGKIVAFLDETKTQETTSVTLSQREIQILQMVKDGYLSKEISDKLDISVHTVNTHRQRLLGKLGANNSMEAVVFASKFGLL